MQKKAPKVTSARERKAQPLKLVTVRQLMTPEQCAEFLGLKVTTLYTMVSQRRIPFRKAGWLLRFDFDEIVQWTKGAKAGIKESK